MSYKDAQREVERLLARVIVPTPGRTQSGVPVIGLASGHVYTFRNGTRRNLQAKLTKKERRKRRRILERAHAALTEIAASSKPGPSGCEAEAEA